MMPQNDPLAALRDIHLPEAVGLWPLAPAWWAVMALGVAIVLGWAWWRRTQRRSPNRAALALVDDLSARFDQDQDRVALATGLSEVLRRIALVRFGREATARLHGADRAKALAGEDSKNGDSAEWIERLETVVYAGPSVEIQPDEERRWVEAVRAFIKAQTPRGPSPMQGEAS